MDVLRWPGIGRFLRWRWGRLSIQLFFLGLALIVIYDGLTGDALAARNLATVSIWVHFRGLVVLALLLAGNLFCMACPFTLPRSLARGRGWGSRRWPSWLKGRWLSISMLFLLFFLYEWLDLWRSPWLTAWIAIAYFVAAFLLEGLFQGSVFCRYVCPLGAFNFVYSAASPLRVRAADTGVCRTCVGRECLNGSARVAGCGTDLFVPAMTSSLDCTLCLDCVRACPHDNVRLEAGRPGAELEAGGWREKPGVGFLAIFLAFMGLLNAFGMTPPVYRWLEAIGGAFGGAGPAVALGVLFLGMGLVLPALLSLAAASASRALSGEGASRRRWIGRFGPAFVPLGLGIWFAHYQFHFLTGALAIVPVAHFFLVDHGLLEGSPDFSMAALVRPSALHTFEVACVALGFLGSFAVAHGIGLRHHGSRGAALRAALPWMVVLLGLAVAAVRVFGYPMEMRGVAAG